MKHRVVRVLIAVLLVIILAGSLAAAGYFYWQYRKFTAASREVDDLTSKLSQVIELPQETPTLATVTDVQKLSAQPFFAHAQNGDKVLIFPNAKKAILYRPSTQKIIEVAPFQQLDTTQTASPTPAPQQGQNASANVVLLNGTKTVGLTTRVATQLKTKFPNVTIVSKASAAKTDYTQTTVVDLSGTNASLAAAIATELNGVVGALPTGETKPSTGDIAIILGQ
jgi:hypothetical protein